MKALFIGLGSVGQRHLNNLNHKYPEIEAYAFRKSDNDLVIKDGEVLPGEKISEYYRVKEIFDESEAMDLNPDIVFITNPTVSHLRDAIKFGAEGANLFIEKPISTDENIDDLLKVVEDKGLTTFVGFQSRFNPLIIDAKKLIEGKKIISASFEWGTYLPDHHKYEDYSKGYAARNDLGGGVILNLIHEMDLIYHLLGMPTRVCAYGGKMSDLNMDVDDTMMCIMQFSESSVASLFLSYAQTEERRCFRIQSEDSTLFANLTKNSIEYHSIGGNVIKRSYNAPRSDLFVDELDHFIECVREKKPTLIDVYEGINSLTLAMAIKNSINEGGWVECQH